MGARAAEGSREPARPALMARGRGVPQIMLSASAPSICHVGGAALSAPSLLQIEPHEIKPYKSQGFMVNRWGRGRERPGAGSSWRRGQGGQQSCRLRILTTAPHCPSKRMGAGGGSYSPSSPGPVNLLSSPLPGPSTCLTLTALLEKANLGSGLFWVITA